jgi:hypothetical protein
MTRTHRLMRLDDVARFAGLMIDTQDLDPVYPVLRRLVENRWSRFEQLLPEPGLTAVLTYAAHYDLPAGAWHVEAMTVTPGVVINEITATERRGLRGEGRFAKHLESMAKLRRRHGGLEKWLRRDWIGDPAADWQATRAAAAEAWGNGRWATYKIAELCKEVLDWPIEAPDMGMAGATGPYDGLVLVFGTPVRGLPPIELERLGETLRGSLETELGRPVTLEQTETVLCDAHGTMTGSYYVGHDIDKMLQQTRRVPAAIAELVLDARRETLDERLLGERHGWSGIRGPRRRAWLEDGLLLAPWERGSYA